jgi:hypothetical protein
LISQPKSHSGFEATFVLLADCAVPRYDWTTVESETHRAFFRIEVVRSASAAVSRDLTKFRTALWNFCISGPPVGRDVELD